MGTIFEIVWISWLLSEILLNLLFSPKKTDKKSDKSSWQWIWLTITASMTLGVYLAYHLRLPIITYHWIKYVGLGLMIIGIIVRFVAIGTLGRYFTVKVSIAANHKLVSNGLYKYIRHPSYTGALLTFFGFSLSIDNWVSLLIIMIPIVISFLYRMNIEEQALLEQKDLNYSDYQKRTKRLIPGIY